MNSTAPLKQIRVKQRASPWLNQEILDAIQAGEQAAQRFKKSQDQADADHFKKHRNEVQRIIKTAKKEYYMNLIKENKNDSKKLWKTLKDMGCGGKANNGKPSIGLEINGIIEFDKVKVANEFNNFFASVASKLVDALPPKTGEYGDEFVQGFYSRQGVQANSFSLSRVSVKKVAEMLGELNTAKAIGLDNISARL